MSPENMVWLGPVAGLLIGGLLGWLLARPALTSARSKAAALDADMAQLGRELAGSEANVHNLHERLEETHNRLNAQTSELKAAGQQLAQLEKEQAAQLATYEQKLAGLQEIKLNFEQSKLQLKTEFQNLANQILEEKGKSLAHSSQTSLDAMLKPLRDQIDGFQKRVNQVHDETLRGNVSLGMEIKHVMEMGQKISSEANSLASALKGDKKTTGNWGEVQLERTLQLAGLMPDVHYQAQPAFKDQQGNRRQPDFIVKLPDQKHIVIDSKVSLVDYDRAIAAQTDSEIQMALDAHVKAVKNHIDDLGKKDYSNLIGMRSPSFVLMFMPIEPAYIEAMKHNQDLFNYGYQRNVVMVSHTTLMPILKTVANLWMVARSNEQTHELSARAGEIFNQVALVAERLKRLGSTLDTVSTHYNDTVRAVAGQQGLYGKVSRFGELSAKANKALPDIQPSHPDFESERLELVLREPAADLTVSRDGSADTGA